MRHQSAIWTLAFSLCIAVVLPGCDRAEEKSQSEPESDESSVDSIVIPESGKRLLTGEEQNLVVSQLLKARAQQQAEGLGSGGVRVNGAWNYHGYSYLSPDPNAAIEARLVAVDITVSGHTEHFDIDDVEIVDGVNLMSYGSDPHATPLTLDGQLMPENEFPDPAPKGSRWLLIYAYPKNSPTFHLYYWGKALTSEPVSFQDRGLELPFPASPSE